MHQITGEKMGGKKTNRTQQLRFYDYNDGLDINLLNIDYNEISLLKCILYVSVDRNTCKI